MFNSRFSRVLFGVGGLGVLISSASTARAVIFSPGDLVIYRVGNGTQALANTGNSVFLDEYSPTGTLVQSIAVPDTGSSALLSSGTASSEGQLNLSPDGQYLALTGYNANVGQTTVLTSSASATVNRTVDLFGPSGTVVSTTKLSDFSTGNNPRAAFTTDGNSLYVVGGAGGIRYTTVGSTVSTQLSTTTANLRDIQVANGQLYVTSSSGSTRIATVGTGTPTTSGQTITNLPGILTTNSTSPYAFFFADESATVAGVDTLYVADDSSGIEKYSLSGNNWVLNGTIGSGTSAVRGLTGTFNAGTVTLFATTGGTTATGGGTFYDVTDTSGYNTAPSTTTLTTLASASPNEAFRGIAFVPTAVPEPASLAIFGLAGMFTLARRRKTL